MYQKKARITPLDILIIALLAILTAYIVYRLTTKLNYKWNWGIIPQYLYFFDEEKGRWTANVLMQGLYTTIRLSVWATLLATILGTVAGGVAIKARSGADGNFDTFRYAAIPNSSLYFGLTGYIGPSNPPCRRFSTRILPMEPARSLAPITATDAGRNSASRFLIVIQGIH